MYCPWAMSLVIQQEQYVSAFKHDLGCLEHLFDELKNQKWFTY